MTRETDIHNDFIKWLKDHQIPFIHHRTDRKSGIQKGMPDFAVFFMSRVVLIEVKSSVGRLRPDQVKMIEYIRRSGNKVEIARSVRECVEAVKSILCEGKVCTDPPGGCNYPLEECFKELKRVVAAVPVPKPPQFADGDFVCRSSVLAACVLSWMKRYREQSEVSAAAAVPVNGTEDLSGGRNAGEVSNVECGVKKSGMGTDQRTNPPPAQNFFIGDWQGTPMVFAPDQDGAYRMIRQASAIDVAHLPRFPS